MPSTMPESRDVVDAASIEEAADVITAIAWPVNVKLAYPVELGKETITELTFRRGRMADIKGIRVDQQPSSDQIMMIASRLSGKPLRVIELLDADDASEVITLALAFFARCLGVGKTG